MKYVLILLLAAHASIDAASLHFYPLSESNVTDFEKEVFNETSVIYRGQHDIIKLYSPVFLMEIQKSQSLFFVEADINSDGSKIYRGLYIMVNNHTKKLLDQGRAMDGDGLGNVYFGASDGIYTYNAEENIAEKYGSMNDAIISIAVENNTGVIYALNDKHELFKITNNGMTANIDNQIIDAQDVAMDIRNDHLYYYDSHNNVYIVANGTKTKVKGLPENPSKLTMIKAPILTEGMLFLVNKERFLAYGNGTSVNLGNQYVESEPTAYSFEAGVILYHSREKKIYEYNILTKILTGIFDEMGRQIKKKVEDFFS